MDSQETVNTSSSLTYSAEPEKKSFSRKNLILIIFFVLVLAGIPAATFMLQKAQVLKSKASVELMASNLKLPEGVSCEFDKAADNTLKCNTTTQVFNIELVSAPDEFTPFAAATATPAPAGATNTPTPAGAATATPGPTATGTPPTATPAPAGPTATQPPPPPAPLSGVKATCKSSTQVEFSWTQSNSDQKAYYTFVPKASKDDPSAWSPWALAGTPPVSITINSGVIYEWKIRALGNLAITQDGNDFTCP